ncbi:SpoVR family protein [Klebsiella michiganensis]|uniref:SpoVR family protein n=1 Tax=Klebsiella michiganensis TaxID=1134687 RepID=A0A7H4PKF4_9ENTR|nr:SpoVR family protein [Klebsiella michiganensis]
MDPTGLLSCWRPIWPEVDRVAKLYRLDTYPHQIEVITSEQMMDAYSSVGMPINYPHWSFGKKIH